MKYATSIRLNDLTKKQLDALTAKYAATQAAIVELAIDRMYREEIKTMSSSERIILNDQSAVDWQGPGYYESFTIKGETLNIWQRVGTIATGSNSYYASLAQQWNDLQDKQPAP